MNASDYIKTLANSFPCLKGSVPEPWDVNRFMRSLGVASTGERHAMLFIAIVWNPAYAESQGWRFNLFDALACWDSSNRAAFQAWIENPRMP